MSGPDMESAAFQVGCGVGAVVSGLLFLIALVVISDDTGAGQLRKEAIEHGYAQHDPITGKWNWKEVAEKQQ